MINQVTLVGRLTKDVEVKLKNDLEYARFTLAVNIPNKEKHCAFIDCVVYGKTAVRMQEYVFKGDRVGVVGYINQKSYADKEGKTRNDVVVIVNSLEFLQDREKEDDKDR